MTRIRIFTIDKWIIHQHCLVNELFSQGKAHSSTFRWWDLSRRHGRGSTW